MRFQWNRIACAALAAAALGAGLGGCVALVGGGAAVAVEAGAQK